MTESDCKEAYLVLIKWPNGVEGLLFPRPGNVQIADTLEMGNTDFAKARNDLVEFVNADSRYKGTTLRLIKFERQETLKEYTI